MKCMSMTTEMTTRADGIRQWGRRVESSPSNRKAHHASLGNIALAGRRLRSREAWLPGRRLREASMPSLRQSSSSRHCCKATKAASDNRDADDITKNDNELAAVLAGAESAFLVNCVTKGPSSFTASARGKVLGGQKATWSVSWGAGGRFAECTETEDLSWTVACSGTEEEALCWHTDFMGHSMQLELEDQEAELLTHWVLTGQWASRDVASSMVIERLGGGRSDCLLGLAVTGGRVRGRLSLKKRSWEPQWLEVDTAAGTERWEFANWKTWKSGPRLPGRIKHLPAAGGENMYKLLSIDAETPAAQDPPASPNAGASTGLFAPPADLLKDGAKRTAPVAPESVSYSEAASSKVEAIRAEGGQVLVLGTVDSRKTGYFVLDTGSSGLVLEPSVASELGLNAVGEHFSTGLGDDSIQAGLFRGASLEVGPVTLCKPVFSTMALGGALRPPATTSYPVIGALGYDFLRTCTVRVESRRRKPGSSTPGLLDVSVYPPGAYNAPPHISLSWQPLQFMSKIPMVQAGLCIEEIAEGVLQPLQEQQEEGAGGGGSSVTASGDDGALLASHDTGLFKLCTGVGGTGMVLGNSTATRLHIFHRLLGLQPQGMITGAGSQQARLKGVDDVVTVRLKWVELVGMRFEAVRAVVHTKGDPLELELGAYASGQLAGDLFRGDCLLVIDYPNRRLSASRPPAEP